MNQTEKSKKFLLEYWDAMRNNPKTEELIRKYVADERLVNHILFFDKAFPDSELFPQEVIVENEKIFVRYILKGTHLGEVDDIPPTLKEVKVPFAVGYKIKNAKIADFWTIADQMELLEQLGLSAEQMEVSAFAD